MISIIVPIYNSEDALCTCVSSLLCQTYSDIEIILVDDGSKDKSGTIADEFAEKDSRINVIHKPNGGASSARNAGIKKASGEFIVFCDSDDTIMPEYCEVMLDFVLKYPEAVVMCAYYSHSSGKTVLYSDNAFDYLSYRDFLKVHNRDLVNLPTNKIFKTDIISEYKIVFDESLSLGEDLQFCLEYMKHTSGMVVINKPLYNYRDININSLSSIYRPDMEQIQYGIIDKINEFLDIYRIGRGEDYCALYFKSINNIMKNNLKKESGFSFLQAVFENSRILKRDEFIKSTSSIKFTYLKKTYFAYRSGNYLAVFLFHKLSQLKQRKKRKKIFLKAYAHVNLGDDLFIDIITRRYPGAKFVMFAGREYKEIFKDRDNLKIIRNDSFMYRLFRKASALLKTDASVEKNACRRAGGSVYIGGSIFIEHERTHKKALRAFENSLNRRFSTVIGANFGPYKHESFREDYKDLFKRLDDICFRDKSSYELFSNLKNSRYAPDVIFNLGYRGLAKTEKRVFVSVIDLKIRPQLSEFQEAYIKVIAGLINYLAAGGYIVEIASFCEYEGDAEAVEEIMKILPPGIAENVVPVYYRGDIEDILTRISRAQIVLASRFHACILGLIYGKKVLPLVYSSKTSYYLKSGGIDIEYIKIEDIEKLSPCRFEEIMDGYRYPDIRKEIKDSKDQFIVLDRYLNGK